VPLLLFSVGVGATVYYSKQEALELAFGKDALVEMLPLFLEEEQAVAVERLARLKLEGRLYTFYVGKRGDQILGYAAIESHTVRTKPEVLMVVLSPEGRVRQVVVLAFHEPPEYEPAEWWLRQFVGKRLEELSWQKIDALSGATLTSRAVLKTVRKVVAIFQVVVRGKRTPP